MAFYLVLLHVVVFCGLATTAWTGPVGWSLIALLLLTIVYNICVLIYCSLRYFKLIGKRFMRMANAKKAAIRRRSQKVSNIKEQVQPSVDVHLLKPSAYTINEEDPEQEEIRKMPFAIQDFSQEIDTA